ncbi:hypothetical protein OAE48_00680 [Flavobacteriales bacterium]|nr:hypothetical protein [Flavobacteriales bacterium]
MNLGKLIFRIALPSRSKALDKALVNDRLTRDELKKLQRQKFELLLQFARENCSYYSDYPTFSSGNSMSSLPLLSKDIIRANVDGIKAKSYTESELKKNSTSGSSGDALHFYSDNKLDDLRQAIAMRGNEWAGQSFGQPLLMLWGSVADVNKTKQFKTRVAHSPLLFNQKILSSFNMKQEDIVEQINTINSFKPAVIVGYPSSLEAFAEFVLDGKRKIHKPNGIITSGETLFEPQRKRIEEAFGCKVMNRYGSREMGNIASECPHQNGLHIHEDHVIVEILNEKEEPCKAGELGEIVVTDLDNFGFPMIRYRIGDLGSFAEAPCSCGKPYRLLNRVEGRVFDLVVGTNGNRIPGNYFTLYFRKLPGIKRFQVQQKPDLSLKILLETNHEYSEETEQKLIAGLKEQLGSDINLELKQVTEIAPTASGKHRWVISEASPFVQHGS